MSFILDALKKSENERQRHVGPSLADVQVRRRPDDRPWWVVAVAGLLVINLGVLLVVLMRRDGEPAEALSEGQSVVAAPARQAPERVAAASSTPSANASTGITNPAVHSLADAAGVTDAAAIDPSLNADLGAAAANVPEGPPMVRPIEAPTVTPASIPALRSRPAADTEILPTHSDIVASGTTLPEMHLDIHVYSANPAERFVFVNMRKYVEGQTLSEGSQVERITTDGAVLNHRGLRFLLPRQ